MSESGTPLYGWSVIALVEAEWRLYASDLTRDEDEALRAMEQSLRRAGFDAYAMIVETPMRTLLPVGGSGRIVVLAVLDPSSGMLIIERRHDTETAVPPGDPSSAGGAA